MTASQTATQTVNFQRVLRCPPERLYRAFTTPAAMAKWLPPHGFTFEQVRALWRMEATETLEAHSAVAQLPAGCAAGGTRRQLQDSDGC